MNIITRIILPALVLSSAAAHAQLSAYLPQQGQAVFSLGYQFQTYDEFYVGKTKIPLKAATGFKEQNQQSASLTIEYGVTDRIAVDASVGWTWARFRGGPINDLTDDGFNDTNFGVRFKLVDEHDWLPTLTVRAGGIIAGTYDEAFPFSAGDGANGAEVSLIVGKQICDWLGYYGDVGYRWRDNDVPDDFFFASGFWARAGSFVLSAGYRHTKGQSGPDIGAPGFGTAFGFPQVKEINQTLETSLTYQDDGGRNYSLSYGRTLDGQNTGDKDMFGASISIPFGPGAPAPSQGKTVRGYSK